MLLGVVLAALYSSMVWLRDEMGGSYSWNCLTSGEAECNRQNESNSTEDGDIDKVNAPIQQQRNQISTRNQIRRLSVSRYPGSIFGLCDLR